MRNHNEKIARAAHIKPRTAGTSNEISFSVLDAAKQGQDVSAPKRDNLVWNNGAAGRNQVASDVSRETSEDYLFAKPAITTEAKSSSPSETASFQPGIPVYSHSSFAGRQNGSFDGFDGSTSASFTLSDRDEISRRKRARKRNRAALIAVAAVACVVIVLGVAWVWHSQVSAQQNYESKLVEALRLIDESDDVVMAIDDLVNEPFADNNQAKRKTVTMGISDAREHLNKALGEAKEASSGLSEGTAKQAANETVTSVTSRLSMLETGEKLLNASQDAMDGTSAYSEAWNRVLAADEIVREASKLTSSSETEQSKAKFEEALSTFQDARTKVSNVYRKYSQVDLNDVLTYIDMRIEAMGYAIASDKALIEKNKEEAVAQNDKYNEAEKNAAGSALSLPAHPEQLYRNAYSSNYSDTLKSYRASRSQAGTSDSVIREYLGAEGK